MSTLKKVLPIIKKFKSKTRPILQNVLVTNNTILMNDFETFLQIKNAFGLDNGLHNIDTLGLVGPTDLDVTEYPIKNFIIDPVDTVENVTVEILEDLLKYASEDETRLHLNGVAVNNSHLVAVNGHILKKYPIEETTGNYIIPRTALKLLVRLAKKFKGVESFDFKLNEEYLVLDNEFFSASVRLINGEYPKWEIVIPRKLENEFHVTNWINFKEIKPLLNKFNNKSYFEYENGKVNLVIEPESIDPVKFEVGTSGVPFENLGFNCKYLEIASNNQKEFTVKFNNAISPCEVNGAIVMPLKL